MVEQKTDEKNVVKKKPVEKRLEGAVWGLLFILVGAAFLAKFHLGVGLLGVGIIILGGQVARKASELKFEGFWLLIGLLFVLGGIVELFITSFSIVPILLIVAGVVLLISSFRGKRTEAN